MLQVEALGRTWCIDTAHLDDDEFMERMGELQEGNPFVIPRIGKTLLGEEEYAAARELLRDPETGRVKASDMLEFVGTVLQGGSA